MEELIKYAIPALGLFALWTYIKAFMERSNRRRDAIKLIELESEAKELRAALDKGIEDMQTKKKEYEDAKKYFDNKYNASNND